MLKTKLINQRFHRYILDFSGRTDTLYNSKLHDIIQKEVFTNDAEPDTKKPYGYSLAPVYGIG